MKLLKRDESEGLYDHSTSCIFFAEHATLIGIMLSSLMHLIDYLIPN